MRAPDGTLISQMELHDLEKLSLIKYDLLSVEGMDRIQTCLELLVQYGYIEKKPTLKETYESAIGTYKIERNSPKMWEMVWNHEITSLFQMEQQSGIQGIALTKPKNVDDLSTLNSIIRLMGQEKGAETPLETYTRFRQDKNAFDDEMKSYGLTDEERAILHEQLDISSGLCIAQEQFMKLVQLPECGGWDLQWSDKLRKAVAKKSPKDYVALEKQFFERAKEQHLSENFCNYVWNRQIALSRGYSFNFGHTLGYSLVALQEMNLAYNYPIIFWNTACLIVDSAGIKTEDDEDDEIEFVPQEEEEEEIVSIYEPEEWEDYEYEDLPDRSGKKKKKVKTVDYDKIASAIGKFKSYGIKVSTPDINTSTYTFTPNVKENTIMYGLRGISRISTDLVNTIISNRPYSSVNDFVQRVKVNKVQMVNLIKCGAFDNIEGKERSAIMNDYISSIADHKNKLTLSNMPALIEKNLIPEEMTKYKKIFLFNKHLKQDCKKDVYYILGQKEINFITNNFDADLLIDGDKVSQKKWDNCYSKSMEPMRVFLKENMDELLNSLNNSYFEEENSKYANGNISKWEMESLSFYYHKHELDYGNSTFDNFFDLPEVPIVEQSFQTKDGNTINIYRLSIIAGTVIARDKNKNMVTLLTQYGVVNVKVYKNQFAMFDKQISCVDDEGNKKVIEKSWFSRGNLLMVQGFRRGQNFVPKKYKSSIYPVISKITKVNENDSVELQYERIEVSNAE